MLPVNIFFPFHILVKLIMHIAGINPLNLMKCSGGRIPHFLAVFQPLYPRARERL